MTLCNDNTNLYKNGLFQKKNRIPPVEDVNFLSEGVISKIVTDFLGGMPKLDENEWKSEGARQKWLRNVGNPRE